MTAEERTRNFFHQLPLGTTFKQAEEAMLKAIIEAVAERDVGLIKWLESRAAEYRNSELKQPDGPRVPSVNAIRASENDIIAAAIRKVKP